MRQDSEQEDDAFTGTLCLVLLSCMIFGIGVLMGLYDRAQVLRAYVEGMR